MVDDIVPRVAFDRLGFECAPSAAHRDETRHHQAIAASLADLLVPAIVMDFVAGDYPWLLFHR